MKVALGDAAYGGGKLARPSPTRDAGWWPRRQGVPTGLIFPRTPSVLTLEPGLLHLSGGECHPNHAANEETERPFGPDL